MSDYNQLTDEQKNSLDELLRQVKAQVLPEKQKWEEFNPEDPNSHWNKTPECIRNEIRKQMLEKISGKRIMMDI